MSNPYEKPLKPRHTLELLRWVVMEPSRVLRYEEALTKKEKLVVFLKAYGLFVLLFMPVWLLGNVVLAWWEVPSVFLDIYIEDFQAVWSTLFDFEERLAFLLKYNLSSLAVSFGIGLAGGWKRGLAFGLAGGLAFGLAGGLAFGLAGGLTGSLAGGLAFGLAFGLGFGLEASLAGGLEVGLEAGLARGLTLGLALGFVFGLIFGLTFGLTFGLAFELAFIPLYYIFLLRLPIYSFYVFAPLDRSDFARNPYLNDENISLPLPSLKRQLLALSTQQPKQAEEFVAFLLEHRPLQRGLASALLHTSTAGWWRQASFKADHLHCPVFPQSVVEDFKLVGIPIRYKLFTQHLQPGEEWAKALSALRDALITYQHETNLNQRLDKLEVFAEALKSFQEQNRAASPRWNHYYFGPLKIWATETEERLQELRSRAQAITRNPYRFGNPLSPEQNRAVFLGRQDLRDELIFRISSAEQMPMFLFHGQRRVGKTSLLYFLPEILSERFRVVDLSAQSAEDFPDLPGFFQNIRDRAAKAMGVEAPAEAEAPRPSDWLTAWRALVRWLTIHARDRAYKLVIAVDEYEMLHQEMEKDNTAAARLLAAMRDFTQRQNQVVFLFIGAVHFFELEQPDWGRYFVNSVPLKVGYLSKEYCLQLITQPTPDFDLGYAPGIAERIWELTQGHPNLTQEICSHLVDYANLHRQSEIGPTELETILAERILVESNHTLNLFWNEFCSSPVMKETVKAVIHQQPPTDMESLKRLLRHEFVLEAPDGGYRLCTPLFEEWVRAFVLRFE